MEKYFRFNPNTPRKKSGQNASAKNDEVRARKAEEQVKLPSRSPDEVQKIVEKFFQAVGVKIGFKIKKRTDFIWLKFTKDNYLGVVAAGYDFNFSKTNRSGKYVKSVGKEWNEELIIVFPISEYPDGRTRSDIERALGNYIIDQNIPIIDFFSHNY